MITHAMPRSLARLLGSSFRSRERAGLGGLWAGVISTVMAGVVVLVTLAGAPPARAVPTPAALPSWCERTVSGYRCLVGPIPTPPGQTVELVTAVAAPSEVGYVTSARATLVDAAGEQIDYEAVGLRHAVWLNPMARDVTCASYDGLLPGYERFFASGKERTPMELPDGYGYYWSNGLGQRHTQSAPSWGLLAKLDGGTGQADTFLALDVGFASEAAGQGMTPIRPVWLDVRNCRSQPAFDVEEGSGKGGVHRESWTHQLAVGGRFVFLAGHLRDGGLALQLENATTGTEVFTSEAVYDSPAQPWALTAMTTLADPAGPTVRAGDDLRLTAVYDSTHARRDVIGIMLGALVPAPSPPAEGSPAGADSEARRTASPRPVTDSLPALGRPTLAPSTTRLTGFAP